MKLYEAKDLIKDVFEHAFDKDCYIRLIKNLLKDIEEKTFTYQGNIIPNAFENYIRKMERIGKFEDEEGNSIDILVVELKREHSIEYARSAQRNFVRWYLSGSRGGQMKDAALVAFHSEKSSDWRFSLIKMQYSLETKKDEFTPAKRFSFLVGEEGKSHTAQQQLVKLLKSDDFPLLSDLEGAFNIESVTNEFFEKYKALVFNLVEELEKIIERDTIVKNEFESKNIAVIDFAKKLMGQIVFLYFLQRKGWLGLKNGERYGEGDRRFLRSLYNMKQPNQNFFNDYLEFLFYEALSKKRVTDEYARFNCRIPFLNGGLFDPISFYDLVNTGDGILDIFDLYNFTVNEAEPLEKEVAIDPEMLGKVFERMLDVKERKSKGAFYTPREIVHYMSQESLIHYLDTALNDIAKSYQPLGDEKLDMFGNEVKKGQSDLLIQHGHKTLVPKEDIEILIKHSEQLIDKDTAIVEERLKESANKFQIPESIRKRARLIDEKLRDIRVCDPAVGSGAFPVGVMTEIVKARQILTPFIISTLEVGQGCVSDRTSYAFKSHCIHHNLYGVDIDPSAVEICKLRLWLSLVVDEQRIDVIEPLPNLDYKIVRGNSLINMPDGVAFNDELRTDINRLMEKYYAETDKQAKRNLKDKIDGKIKQLLKSAEQFTNYPIDFDFKLFFHEVFKEKGGFDVVFGNPPYGANFSTDEKKQLSILYPIIKGQPESYEYFLFHSIDDIDNNIGICCFIVPTNFIESSRAENLRNYIIDKTNVLIISNFRFNVWDSNASETQIFMSRKGSNKYKTKVMHPINIDDFVSENNINLIDQKIWRQIPGSRFLIRSNPDFINRIQKNCIKLKTICDISQGIIVYKTKEQGLKNAYISNKENGENWVKLLDGKSKLKPYKIIWGGNYLKYGPWLWCPREEKYFTKPKILFIRLRNKSLSRKLIGAFDNSSYYNRDNFNNIILKDDSFLLKYILALINSILINYWYKSLFDNVNINPTQVGMIPIKKTDKDLQKKFVYLVDYLITLNYSNKEHASLSFFEQLIDGMVFELYFEEEVKKAGRDILKYLTDLTPITDNMNDNQKMQIITKTFNELYDKNNPVRQNLYYMDTIEEIRIIKGLDQDAN